ncbi:MAG: hypothetical protein ACTSVZ_09280 [Promethearchaeota archaeon]
MKIEIMNINYVKKKLEHITSAGIKEMKMRSNKVDSLPPILAYIEDYADQNGFTVLNGVAAGMNVMIFLSKK